MTGDGQSGQKETKNLIRFAGDNFIKVEYMSKRSDVEEQVRTALKQNFNSKTK